MSTNDPLPGRARIAVALRRRFERTRCRVVAGGVAVLVVAGAALGAVVLTESGSPAPAPMSAVADVPAWPTASLLLPPVPSVGGGSAGADLPGDLSMLVPTVRAGDAQTQKLADDAGVWLRAWVSAWASGNTSNPAYGSYCIMQCRYFLDSTVAMWAHAHLRPAGSLRVYNLAAVTTDGGYAGSVTVCVDDSGLYALTSANKTTYNPFPEVGAVMYVFGGVYDTGVNHWIMTQGDVTLGGGYCERTTTPH